MTKMRNVCCGKARIRGYRMREMRKAASFFRRHRHPSGRCLADIMCKVHPEAELFMSKCRAANARRMNIQVVNKLFKCEKGVPNAYKGELNSNSKVVQTNVGLNSLALTLSF